MSRLRVRNAQNTKWVDICQSEWYVRNPSNTGWERFTPKQGIKARHGAESYWLDIDCKSEAGDGCSEDEYGGTPDGAGSNNSGKTTPTTGDGDPTTGGGNGNGGSGGGNGGGNGGGMNNTDSPSYGDSDGGSGRGGTGWIPNAPYPPGFDLPDSDGDGAGLTGGGCIYRPALNTCESRIPIIVRPDIDCGGNTVGGFDCPLACPNSVRGNGAGISEFYASFGTVSGPVRLNYVVPAGGASVDVYYMGKLIASTYGQRGGKDTLRFIFTPVDAKTPVFIRVRATKPETRWTIQIKCAGDDDDDGDITNPRPCHGTFEVKKEGGLGTFEFYHSMGTQAGQVSIHYQMWNQPDKMDVYDDNGKLLKSTGGYVAGEGYLKFNYTPGGTNTVLVRITARDPGTSWIYLITCPGEKGQEDDPRPCDEPGSVKSGGAGVTDTFVNFGPTAGSVGIRYQMYEIPDKLDVYQNGNLVATTGGPVTGDHWLYFAYDPAKGQVCQIRVTGSGKTSWSFLHTCPGEEDPVFDVDSPQAQEGNTPGQNELCWNITMDKPQSTPVTIDYATGGGTGVPYVAEGRILASDEFGNPFIAVVDGPNVGRVAFDGGFPKFYNQAYSPPQSAPTGAAVFDTWFRVAAEEFYSDPAGIPANSEANAWTLSGGNVMSTTNSSRPIAFISPSNYSSYTFEATLSSAAADDDMIGLVAAFARTGSDNWMLVAVRVPGGMAQYGAGNFDLALLRNGSVHKKIGTLSIGTNGNWSTKGQTRVRVIRDCNKITVSCSPFGSEAIPEDTSTTLTCDLSTDPDLAVFLPKAYWGFCAQSQPNALFSNVFVSGIGFPPAFTYLKNLIQWTARSANRTGKVLVTCDNPADGTYSLDTRDTGFATSLAGTVTGAGFTPTLTVIDVLQANGPISLATLKQYDTVIFMGTRVTAKGTADEGNLKAATVSNFAQYVSDGGGLIVITDHYVFQSGANQLAGLFGVDFYDSVDRNPVSVQKIIADHGDHEAWVGLACDTLPAGGSEGAIRLSTKRADYVPASGTLTFAPGETSKRVCVPIRGNETQDGDRTVGMTITNPSKGTINTGTGMGTIIDDDSALCKQRPTGPVHEATGGPDGSYLLYAQDDYNCAAGGVKYLLQAFLNFPYTGPYVFTTLNDDDFELYIDCKKVASGPIGLKSTTVNIQKGTRNVILRYLNVPDCTPGYAGFSCRYNNALVYITRAVDWKGQVNSIGEIE